MDSTPDQDGKRTATVLVRVLDDSGQRVAARVELLDQDGKFLHAITNKTGVTRTDWMPALALRPATAYLLRIVRGEQARDFPLPAQEAGDSTVDLSWSQGKSVDARPGHACLAQLVVPIDRRRAARHPARGTDQSRSRRGRRAGMGPVAHPTSTGTGRRTEGQRASPSATRRCGS